MAASVNNNNMITAVDKLQMMFPTIERPTIQNVVVNECKGDSTKAIIILTRIQQFNQQMNNVNAGGNTAKSAGEVVPSQNMQQQQIPLSVVQPVAQQYAAPAQQECCDCAGSGGGGSGSDDCCYCCLLKPASYKNGLYRIDYNMYSYSFLLFSIFTIYPDTILYELSFSYHGLYCPTIGLLLLFIASLMIFCGKSTTATVDFIRGCLFIFGGLLYFLGYMIHAAKVPDCINNYDSYWDSWYYDWGWGCDDWFWEDIAPEPEYLVGRGCFVGFHAIFVGLLYVANHKLKWCHSRVNLVRFWSFLLLIYTVLVLGWLMNIFYVLIFMAGSPIVFGIALLLNCLLIRKKGEAGGCTAGATLSLIETISFYFCLLAFAVFIIFASFEHDDDQGWYVLWDLSILMFAAFHLWILARAMHPVSANCGCIIDGSGDGNVINQLRIQQPVAQQQVVMVVQQPTVQPQVNMVPVTVSALQTPNEAAAAASPQQELKASPMAITPKDDDKSGGYQMQSNENDDIDDENP